MISTTTTKPTIITIHQKPGGNITNVKQINKRKKNWMKWNELDWVENTTHTHYYYYNLEFIFFFGMDFIIITATTTMDEWMNQERKNLIII